jgi:hypothetical protein
LGPAPADQAIPICGNAIVIEVHVLVIGFTFRSR